MGVPSRPKDVWMRRVGGEPTCLMEKYGGRPTSECDGLKGGETYIYLELGVEIRQICSSKNAQSR